jgi:hypothetical protein
MDEEQKELQRKSDLEQVNKALEKLSEFFDTVQINVSRYDTVIGQTTRVDKGVGNWYARYGQLKAWVEREDESHRVETRNDMKEEN